jgi:predicted acetyltransferase
MRSLGDQVSTIQLLEPGDIQLQDLLKQPMRNRLNSKGSEQENISTAEACWQLRILDLPACLAKTYLPTAGLRFNLKLTDPAPALLDEDHSWTGCGGDYVITLGPTSSVEPGIKSDLPTLKATIGAFSRLWFGIRPASSLAATDELQGPDELLQSLDREVRLPAAHFGWEF